MKEIKERLPGDNKINIQVTVDENLKNNIDVLKKHKRISALSPQINDFLWEKYQSSFNKIQKEENQE